MAAQPTQPAETVRPPRRSPSLVLLAGGPLLVLVLLWLGWSLVNNPALLPPDDFVEYWAAGRLNAAGQDPYSPELLLPLQRLAGRDTDEAIMMWNPPWTLPLVMPLGLLPARVAQLLWLLVNLAAVLFCADWLWRFLDGPPKLRWLAWLLALTFLPTAFALQAGQITPLVLLGVVGFLRFHRINGWLAGACCLLIAVKPHLLYLFWPALWFWGIQQKRWGAFLGGLLTGAAALGVAIACNPSVLAQYHDALAHRPPEQWVSPTAGALLRLVFGEGHFWLQFVPTLAGLAWFVPHWLRHRRSWDWAEQTPLLIMVSLLTASYGAWPFDLVVLLLPLLAVAVRVALRPSPVLLGTALACWTAVDGVALAMNLLHAPSFWFIWMTPAVLAAYLLLRRLEVSQPRPVLAEGA